MIVLILAVGIGAVSEQLTAILLALVTGTVPVAIVRGLVRLLRARGVTLQDRLEQTKNPPERGLFSGPWRTRTSNLGIKSPLLYQLS